MFQWSDNKMKSVWWGSPPFKIPAGGEAYKNLNGKYLLGINTEQIPSSNCGAISRVLP